MERNSWGNYFLSHNSRAQARRRRHAGLTVELLERRDLFAAAVWTNLPDYAPRSTALFSGSGFQVGETIKLQVLHSDGKADVDTSHLPFYVVDGGQGDLDHKADGNFQTSWYVSLDNANSALGLTATGLSSQETAHTTFTDSTGLQVGAQNQTIVYGSGDTATFTISQSIGGNLHLSFDTSITGVDSADFSPTTISTSQSSTLSLHLSTTILAGSYPFTVSGSDDSNPSDTIFTSGFGTLVVEVAPLTITANDQTKTYGDTYTFDGTEFTYATLYNDDSIDSISLSSDGAVNTATVLGSPYAIYGSNAKGSGLANYSISYAQGNFYVNPKTLIPSITANSKTYDSTTDATVDYNLDTVLFDDDVLLTFSTVSFANKHAGTGKTVTAYSPSLTGSDASNYSLSTTGDLTAEADIYKAILTITAVTNTKTYDGNTSADATPTLDGIQGDDDYVNNLSETYDTRHAGSDKTLSVSTYLVHDGNEGGNYSVVTVDDYTGVINRALLTITATTNTKTYDSTTSADAVPTYDGIQFEDDFVDNLSESYDTRHAGTGKTLSVDSYTVHDGNDGGDYSVVTVDDYTGVINKALLTITAQTNTKTYDSTTSADAIPTVDGLQGGISPNIDVMDDYVDNLSETYDTRHVGTGKTLSVATYTVHDGNDGGDYSVVTVDNFTGEITRALLTITAATNTKTYDSTTSADAEPIVDGLQGEDDYVDNLSETYDTRHVGTEKTLSVVSYTVNDGNDGGDYSVVTVDNYTGVINKALLTITAATNTKTYDSTTSADAEPTVDGLQGDDDYVDNLSESYDTRHAGTDKTLSVDSYTVNDGNDGGDYSVVTVDNYTGVINKALLTITATTNTKTYDSTTSADAIPTVDGLQSGITQFGPEFSFDYVDNLSETYDTRHVGTGKTLSVASYTVHDGNDGGDYSVVTVDDFTGEITRALLTITAQTNTKTYDSSTSADATPTVDGLQGDDDYVDNLSEAYDTRHVGTGKTLSVDFYTVHDGNDGGDYSVVTVDNFTGEITRALLTITAQTNTKTYDSTTSADATPTVDGLKGEDDYVDNLSESYDTRHAGTGKSLFVDSYTIHDGNDGGDYTVVTVQNNTGVINKALLTITAVTNTKTYDSTTSADAIPTVDGLQGGIAPEFDSQFNFDYVDNLSETYDTRHVGTGKTLSVATYTVHDGNDGGDYSVVTVDDYTGVINKALLTITAKTNTKTYDASITALAVPTVAGLQGDDDYVDNLSETYDTKNRGTGKTLSVATYTVHDGNDGGDYSVVTVVSTTGVINRKTLLANVLANDKTYDGSTAATLSTQSISGVVNSEDVNVTVSSAYFSNKNAGTNKTVTANLSLTGTAADNYTIAATATDLADITRATLTPGIVANSKVYNNSTAATLLSNSLTGRIGSDNVQLAIGAALFANKNVATNITVTATGLTLTGTDAGNYVLSAVTAASHADITKAHLTVTADSKSKLVGQANPALTSTITGFVGGETQATSGVTGTPTITTTATASSPVGNYPITVSNGTLAAANYDFQFVNGTLTVIPGSLKFTLPSGRIRELQPLTVTIQLLDSQGRERHTSNVTVTLIFTGAGKTITLTGKTNADGRVVFTLTPPKTPSFQTSYQARLVARISNPVAEASTDLTVNT